jgi:hypothetical protein
MMELSFFVCDRSGHSREGGAIGAKRAIVVAELVKQEISFFLCKRSCERSRF